MSFQWDIRDNGFYARIQDKIVEKNEKLIIYRHWKEDRKESVAAGGE